MSAPFILFQGRILNTAHLVSLVPPRIDNGKHVIEARMVGNVTFAEEYEDDEVAAGRYLDLASALLGNLGISEGVRRPDEIADPAAGEPPAPPAAPAATTSHEPPTEPPPPAPEPEPEPPRPSGDLELADLTAKLRDELTHGIDIR